MKEGNLFSPGLLKRTRAEGQMTSYYSAAVSQPLTGLLCGSLIRAGGQLSDDRGQRRDDRGQRTTDRGSTAIVKLKYVF